MARNRQHGSFHVDYLSTNLHTLNILTFRNQLKKQCTSRKKQYLKNKFYNTLHHKEKSDNMVTVSNLLDLAFSDNIKGFCEYSEHWPLMV